METRSFDLPRYLSVLPLFTDLSRSELERLALGCQLRRLSRGDTVFRVGEPCEEFHVTVTGQIKLFAISPAGQEKVIELVGPGNSFAEALMFTGKPYILNAQALTDSCAARSVLIEPGDIFFRKSSSTSQSYLRLGYAAIPGNLIDAGVKEVARAYAALRAP